MSFETHTLANGLRIICAPNASRTVYCGVAVDAGTRDELPHESGMAHFTEHMSFKGTAHRTPRQLINHIERVGGDLNAFTGKEETIYYCAVPRQHLRRALSVLLDITLCSTYAQKEMDKEAEVVIDEIESYNDSPAELIFDEYDSLVFSHHPLGRNILGDADRLRQFTTADMHSFASRLYHPSRMVLYVYGDVSMRQILPLVKPFSKVRPDACPASPPRQLPADGPQRGLFRVRKATHQSHVLVGARCCGAASPHHLSLYLLNNILGGPSMNSRLNLALRERSGLVYTVESSMACYTDVGVWNVYFGCDADDVKRCLRLVRTELNRLCDKPLSESALRAAKRQLKGQLVISGDNGESVAMGMGKRYLHYGTTLTQEQLFDALDALTATQLWHTAQSLFPADNLTTLVYE